MTGLSKTMARSERRGGLLDRALKAVRRGAALRMAVALIGAGYVRLVYATTRWTVEGAAEREAVLREGAFIAAFWHGRLFISPMIAPPGMKVVAMISDNRDGDIITALVERFGVRTVRGSTNNPAKSDKFKGGSRAYAGAVEELAAGSLVAMTPDGPRGPRMRAQHGVASISANAQAPVMPVAFSTRWGKTLGSWDRFLAPWPFGRGAIVYGAPIPAPKLNDPETLERHRLRIEQAITDVTRRADALVGRATPEPVQGPGA